MKNLYSKQAKQAMYKWYENNVVSMNDINDQQTQNKIVNGFDKWGYNEYPADSEAYKESPVANAVIRFDGGMLVSFQNIG